MALAFAAVCLADATADASRLDLVARFPFTDSARVGTIAAGTPTGQAILGSGWRARPHEAAEMVAPRASLLLPLQASSDAELVLACRVPEGSPPRRIAVLVNGRRIAIVNFPEEERETRLRVRASATRPGDNKIVLRDPSIAESGSAHAPGGLRCRSVSLSPANAQLPRRASVRPGPDGMGRIVFPAGSGARFFIPLVADSVLRLKVCDGQVAVRLRGEAGGSRSLVQASGGQQEIPLSSLRGAFALVEFLAVSENAEICKAVVESAAAVPGKEAGVASGVVRPGPVARNLVLVVVDTLRADRLGAYGNP